MVKSSKNWCKSDSPELRRLRSSGRWQKLRESILQKHPICFLCDRIGCAPRLAVEIHHIIPAQTMIDRSGEESFYDPENLVPLCKMHHERNENAWKDGRSETLFDKEKFTWLA